MTSSETPASHRPKKVATPPMIHLKVTQVTKSLSCMAVRPIIHLANSQSLSASCQLVRPSSSRYRRTRRRCEAEYLLDLLLEPQRRRGLRRSARRLERNRNRHIRAAARLDNLRRLCEVDGHI